ncbi:hypothetical protein ACFP2T_43030 [Plantactinospora solaniradicis]|uniref:HNH endonuclease n=2 Tax=Plantactinospora solaniradicis TaxID=1723736 RepID=A0ABW1KQV6_9ACTN
MAECFYCGQDEKLTRAHLFQQRFRDLMGTGDEITRLGSSSHASSGIDRAIEHEGDIRNSVVTALCGDCNNNWMQGIEVAAAPAFATIVRDHGLPQPQELLRLAHWATVVAALASQLHVRIEIPVAMRREIRRAPGQPDFYATYFVWTSEHLDSVTTSFFRVAAKNPDSDLPVGWYHFLHVGPMVAISCTPQLYGRVARVLRDAGVDAVLGCLGDTVLYVPREFGAAMQELRFPSHDVVQELGWSMLGSGRSYTVAKNQLKLLDLSGGLVFADTDLSFDFEGMLFDFRQLPGSNASSVA